MQAVGTQGPGTNWKKKLSTSAPSRADGTGAPTCPASTEDIEATAVTSLAPRTWISGQATWIYCIGSPKYYCHWCYLISWALRTLSAGELSRGKLCTAHRRPPKNPPSFLHKAQLQTQRHARDVCVGHGLSQERSGWERSVCSLQKRSKGMHVCYEIKRVPNCPLVLRPMGAEQPV